MGSESQLTGEVLLLTYGHPTSKCQSKDRSHLLQCVATVPGRDDILIKLLSVDPNNYPDAPVEAIRRVLEQATGRSYPRGEKISLRGVGRSSPSHQMMNVMLKCLESIRMGTTVATNALLERKGERTVFVVTKGLKVSCNFAPARQLLTTTAGPPSYWKPVKTKAF